MWGKGHQRIFLCSLQAPCAVCNPRSFCRCCADDITSIVISSTYFRSLDTLFLCVGGCALSWRRHVQHELPPGDVGPAPRQLTILFSSQESGL